MVDRFGRAAEASGCRSWILTHFHSDHYSGLTSRFKAGMNNFQVEQHCALDIALIGPWYACYWLQLGLPC